MRWCTPIPTTKFTVISTADFTQRLATSSYAVLGTQSAVLPIRVEKILRGYIAENFGRLPENQDVILTYLIQGTYYFYNEHCKTHNVEKLIKPAGIASDAVVKEISKPN